MNTLLEYVDDLINQSSQTKSFWDKHKGKLMAASALGAGALAYKTNMFNFDHKNTGLFEIPSSVLSKKHIMPDEDSIDFSNLIRKSKDVGEIALTGAGKIVNKLGKGAEITGHAISKKYHEIVDPSNLEKQRELSHLRQTRNLYRSLKNQASLDKLSEKIKNYDS